MSEPRKNRLSIDGGQVKDEEHVASYKPIPDSETEFRSSKSNLGKSKEKISADGAEEKLLQKEDEAKIVTRVDMADAKYVVGDHRNGDAKIELDANKREFSGLTKEELMKYADDPFWVNLRWSLFVLFWVAWLCMLAGAIVIIVKAPKCSPPEPKKWFELGPLIDLESDGPEMVEVDLELMQKYKVQGVFMETPTYEILDDPEVMKPYTNFFQKAKDFGIKVIVDLTPNFVSSLNHTWFVKSENRTEPYTNYFAWAPVKEYDADSQPVPPNKWVSTYNTSAWKYSSNRKEFFLQQFEERPDLNFTNPAVVEAFEKVIRTWMEAGASGVRLLNSRQLLVDASARAADVPEAGRGALGLDHTQYGFWRQPTYDQPALPALLQRFAGQVHAKGTPDAELVFTIKEASQPELYVRAHNVTMLNPPSAAPIRIVEDVDHVAAMLNKTLASWPALKMEAKYIDEEVAAFSLLLPAAPVFELQQLKKETNETLPKESLLQLIELRSDSAIQHGQYVVTAAPVENSTHNVLLVCARWKAGHSGYVAVYNPLPVAQRGRLGAVPSLPDSLTLHHVSHEARKLADYEGSTAMDLDAVLVPPKSAVILSYVPRTSVEE